MSLLSFIRPLVFRVQRILALTIGSSIPPWCIWLARFIVHSLNFRLFFVFVLTAWELGWESAIMFNNFHSPNNSKIGKVKKDIFKFIVSTHFQTAEVAITSISDYTLHNITRCPAALMPGTGTWAGIIQRDFSLSLRYFIDGKLKNRRKKKIEN